MAGCNEKGASRDSTVDRPISCEGCGMKVTGTVLALAALGAAATVPAVGAPLADDASSAQHAVFVMTNDADANEVIAFERAPNGTLHSSHRYPTGGRGSGGTVDPLGSQGSLTLTEDGTH